jgi:hypothetical protein
VKAALTSRFVVQPRPPDALEKASMGQNTVAQAP